MLGELRESQFCGNTEKGSGDNSAIALLTVQAAGET
jgi:hypothetical protein